MSGISQFLITFLVRLLAAIGIVLATYNPTGYSYVHWVLRTQGDYPWVKLAVGVGLFIVYYAVISIARGSLRRSGIVVGAVVGLLVSIEAVLLLVPRSQLQSLTGSVVVGEYVVLVSFAMVLAFGLSWSSLIEGLTGQSQKRYVAGPPTPPPPPALR